MEDIHDLFPMLPALHGNFVPNPKAKSPEEYDKRHHKLNKIVPSLDEAIRLTGLKDGMTISFHHHFRNGDYIVNMVVDKLAEMGYKNLTLAASSLSSIHAPLIEHIRNGVITRIETSGLRGELAEAISHGLMDIPVVFRSHGGRAYAIETGELKIDVAFLGAPSCDPSGNANGYSRDGSDSISCGSLGYARMDAIYGEKVIILTNHIVPYPNAPFGIAENDVDYIVEIDQIGDPAGIMSGATRFTSNPKELLIARTAANVIEASGKFVDGFSMQTGSGGASLAVTRFLREKSCRKSSFFACGAPLCAPRGMHPFPRRFVSFCAGRRALYTGVLSGCGSGQNIRRRSRIPGTGAAGRTRPPPSCRKGLPPPASRRGRAAPRRAPRRSPFPAPSANIRG